MNRKNQHIIIKIIKIFELTTSENYKYIKFYGDNEDKYFEICDLIVYEWLESFNDAKTISNENELTKFEFHNGKIIINYLPMEYYNTFSLLYKQLCSGNDPIFISEQEQINYLVLLWKLTSFDKIEFIIDQLDCNMNIWSSLKKNGCDLVAHLDNKKKFEMTSYFIEENSDDTIYNWFTSLGLPWSDNNMCPIFYTYEYNSHVNYNVDKYERLNLKSGIFKVYDNLSKIGYDIVLFKKYLILFNPIKLQDETILNDSYDYGPIKVKLNDNVINMNIYLIKKEFNYYRYCDFVKLQMGELKCNNTMLTPHELFFIANKKWDKKSKNDIYL